MYQAKILGMNSTNKGCYFVSGKDQLGQFMNGTYFYNLEVVLVKKFLTPPLPPRLESEFPTESLSRGPMQSEKLKRKHFRERATHDQ